MAMPKKHFEQFAAGVKAQVLEARDVMNGVAHPVDQHKASGRIAALRKTAGMFADMAAQDNPAFDRRRFEQACALASCGI